MAKTRCPARYKNLGLETFGEKKKVTEEILKQCCKNDEWLRQNIEEVRYLTPPAVRKRLKIAETIDDENSWGCETVNGKVQFSNRIDDTITMDFTTEEGLKRWFDDVKSNAESYEKNKNADGSKYTYITLPKTETVVTHEKVFGTGEKYRGYNSAWYVGFDKTKNFYLRPKWIRNWKSIDVTKVKNRIPAIARAQTFKVPSGYAGDLMQVDLQLEYNGTPTMTSSPLWVQIWDTYEGWVNKTRWDNKQKKVVMLYEKISKFKRLYGIDPPKGWQRYTLTKVYDKDKKGKQIYLDKAKTKKKWHYDVKRDKKGKWIHKRRKVAKPKSRSGKTIKKPLAEYVYTEGKGGLQTMTFPNTPRLEAGKHYAIVLFSPLNNWENCPRWCGWGRNCNRDVKNDEFNDIDYTSDGAVYSGGDAFYSVDNGISWKRYGRKGLDEGIKVYRQGKQVPQDYRFTCRVRTAPNESRINYPTETHYLYLKPIYHNPINKIKISSIDIGSEMQERDRGIYVDYQFSTNGHDWEDINLNEWRVLSKSSKVLFVRALLQTEIPGDANTNGESPSIEKITVDLKMDYPTEMYARTKEYKPEKFGTILGASVWGRVFAPYTLEDETVDCKVGIIETKVNEESFDIVDLELLDEKLAEIGYEAKWLENCETADARCEYLTDNPEILKELKEDYKIYILPHEMEDLMYNLSFAPSYEEEDLIVEPLDSIYSEDVFEEEDGEGEDEGDLTFVDASDKGWKFHKYPDNMGGIHLIGEVAYPVVSCQLEPEDGAGHGEPSPFTEWHDYIFDYKTNQLIFKRDSLKPDRMATGNLIIKYNPVFIKDLTNNEVGIHYDEDGNRTDGLILDYFKEKIAVTNEIIASNKVKLKVDALDPIRQVYLHSVGSDEPISLIEDSDYYYDVDKHEILFDADEMTPILRKDDVLEIVYTPNLDDTSICIEYNATRKDVTKQCYIDDYYIEYKV